MSLQLVATCSSERATSIDQTIGGDGPATEPPSVATPVKLNAPFSTLPKCPPGDVKVVVASVMQIYAARVGQAAVCARLPRVLG